MALNPVVSELPDHVPLFLEFLGVIDADQAQALLDEAIHVLAAIGSRLARGDSYACVFAVLRDLSGVTPREQTEAPVRDMDEAMETFGAGGRHRAAAAPGRPGRRARMCISPRGTAAR